MTTEILIAGFGGQGVLFAGKFIAYKGLLEGRQVSWLPSYGPEMRGGTANCSVILSDAPVGSPIVSHPDILIAMNLPSLDKYEQSAKPGGYILVDSALIGRKVERSDLTAAYIPATKMAMDAGYPTLANMVMAGFAMQKTGMISFDKMTDALRKVVSAKHEALLEINLRAIEAGYHFA
ncbi:MAG: 2-oxoacid:acceptor oxidoreductase family protein [Eubacteriales bacterium]